MTKDNAFMLVSLKDKGAKKLAQVINNDTCKDILEQLAKKEASETDLSKELGLAMSTVHYNLQNLVEAKLVKANEYHYSKKGKEVLHYSLANKFVIIAPDGTDKSILNKLKSLIPAGIIAGGLAFAIKFLGMVKSSFKGISETTSLAQREMVMEAAPVAKDFAAPAAPLISDAALTIIFYVAFIAITTTVLYLLFEWIRRKRK